ncbi:MAG: hypothetical protein D6726_12300 [Nitrospirae bacterium]|nr:MAG: hypothetical protein D6726_12300 [Nitrospirota bacterium]
MKRRILVLLNGVCLLIISLLTGVLYADDQGAQKNVVIAEYNGHKFTQEDLTRIMGYYEDEKRDVLRKKPEFKLNIVNRIVQTSIIAELARKEGFDKRVDVREQLKLLIDDYLAQRYLDSIAAKDVNITNEDIELYYKSKSEQFKVPSMVRARHILIKVKSDASEDEKKAARKKAEEILSKIKNGEDFASLAEEYSDDPGSAKKGGDLGYFPRGRMVKPFEDAAFSLKPGEVSDIVETAFGYHIIKVDDKKDAHIKPLEEVKDMIRKKLEKELKSAKAGEFLRKAMEDAGVKIYKTNVLETPVP